MDGGQNSYFSKKRDISSEISLLCFLKSDCCLLLMQVSLYVEISQLVMLSARDEMLSITGSSIILVNDRTRRVTPR